MPSPTTAVFEVTVTTPADCGGDPTEQEICVAVFAVACDINGTVAVRRIIPGLPHVCP